MSNLTCCCKAAFLSALLFNANDNAATIMLTEAEMMATITLAVTLIGVNRRKIFGDIGSFIGIWKDRGCIGDMWSKKITCLLIFDNFQ